jgi:hypothetical protein
VAARGGYQALWLTGVALAPEQIDNVALGSRSQTTVNEDGSVFYHGPYAMLEFTW